MYARLRGVAPPRIERLASRLLDRLGLSPHADKCAPCNARRAPQRPAALWLMLQRGAEPRRSRSTNFAFA